MNKNMEENFKPSDKSGKAASDGTFRPQITSLIDVMTILLVFLLKSFSVEGELVTPSKDLELPLSTSEKKAKPVLSVEITRNEILMDGERIGRHEGFKDKDTLSISVLYDRMIAEKEKIGDNPAGYDVMIQCDRRVRFNIIKRVMYTCSRAGFTDFSVLTIEED